MKKYLFIATIGFLVIFGGLGVFDLVNKNNLLQIEKEINISHQKKLLGKVNDFSKKSKELVEKKQLLDNTINELYNSIRNLQNKMSKLSVESGELEVGKRNLQDELAKVIENGEKVEKEKEKNRNELESLLKLKEENFKAELDSTKKRLTEFEKKSDKLARELKDVEEERMVDLDNMMKALVGKEGAFKKIVEEKEREFRKQLEDKENELIKVKEENVESLQVKKLKEDIKKIRFAYYYNSGVLYSQNHQYEEAVREYLNALRIDENNAQVHYNLGIIFDGYGNNIERAVSHYEKYLELEPDAKDAGQVKKWLEAAKERINQ